MAQKPLLIGLLTCLHPSKDGYGYRLLLNGLDVDQVSVDRGYQEIDSEQ